MGHSSAPAQCSHHELSFTSRGTRPFQNAVHAGGVNGCTSGLGAFPEGTETDSRVLPVIAVSYSLSTSVEQP